MITLPRPTGTTTPAPTPGVPTDLSILGTRFRFEDRAWTVTSASTITPEIQVRNPERGTRTIDRRLLTHPRIQPLPRVAPHRVRIDDLEPGRMWSDIECGAPTIDVHAVFTDEQKQGLWSW